MAQISNKCSLDNMLKSILSIGNTEANQSYPPRIFTDQYNTVSAFLLSALCKAYPTSQEYHDMIEPFINFKPIKVTDGYIQLPDDYRELLGSPSINVQPDGAGECGSGAVIAKTESEFKTITLKSGCRTRPLTIVPKSEWDERTTSDFDFPTYNDPIGYFQGGKKIKVCPYDLATVYVLYCRQEKIYRYGYIQQPDDTYIFDINTTEESEWTSAAFQPMFRAMMALYAAYTRDQDMRDFSLILNEKGIL